MSGSAAHDDAESPSLEAYLLGRVALEQCLELQRRLADDIAGRDDGRIALVVCEHEPAITVGRAGSPLDVARGSPAIKSRQIGVRWVARGGGSMLHCPGQLAIYPIVPLRWHALSVGEYLDRLLAAVVETLDDLRIPARVPPGRFGAWGRTGQLAAVGISVRHGVTRHGVWLNVCPPMGLFKLIGTDPAEGTPMSCLAAERRGHVRMSTVRSTLVPHLAETLRCGRYHLHSGHRYVRDARTRPGT